LIATSAILQAQSSVDPAPELPEPSPSHLPQWRAFNLLENFSKEWSNKPFVENDFRMIKDLGFNFI